MPSASTGWLSLLLPRLSAAGTGTSRPPVNLWHGMMIATYAGGYRGIDRRRHFTRRQLPPSFVNI